MATVYFITDVKPGEPDILKSLIKETLKVYVVNLTTNQKELVYEEKAPFDGWTHNKLELVNDTLIKETKKEDILEAYLSSEWVGSSEC